MADKYTPQDKALTRAETLCDAHGLDFATVFAQQFCIARKPDRPLPGFRQHDLGDWVVQAARDLPCITARILQDGAQIALLGVAVDDTGAVVTQTRLAQLGNWSDAIDYLCACAGRYAFVMTSAGMTRAYLDPLGTLGAVYDPQAGRMASTLNLLLRRDLVVNDDYVLTSLAAVSKARFAFGHTPDKYAKRVLPNHYLDLDVFTQHRCWPTADSITDAPRAAEGALLTTIANRLGQVVAGLAAYGEAVKLPLSGGLDSRVLLACAKPSLDRLMLYSHAESGMSRKDTRIAGRLARFVGQPMAVYDPTRDPAYQIDDPEQILAISNARQIAIGEGALGTPLAKLNLEVLHAPPAGGLVLRGNGVDFLKAVLWRRAVREYRKGAAHDPQMGLRMMMLADRSTMDSLDGPTQNVLLAEYKAWFDGLSGVATTRAYDLMFAEQFLSHGAGNLFYGFTRNFYICPFSDRKLLAAATSLAPDRRAQLYFTEAIIAARAPELQQMWYTRKAVNEQLTAQRAKSAQWYPTLSD